MELQDGMFAGMAVLGEPFAGRCGYSHQLPGHDKRKRFSAQQLVYNRGGFGSFVERL
jgi:hypothetical protein